MLGQVRCEGGLVAADPIHPKPYTLSLASWFDPHHRAGAVRRRVGGGVDTPEPSTLNPDPIHPKPLTLNPI